MSEADKSKIRHQIAVAVEKAKKTMERPTAVGASPDSGNRQPKPSGTIHYFTDSARVGGFVASIAFAQSFSGGKANPLGVGLGILAAAIFAYSFLHGLGLRHGLSRPRVYIATTGVIFLLCGYGWWLNEPPYLDVIFKNPDQINLYRRFQIRRQMTRFALYASQIGIDVPKAVPPIGVGEKQLQVFSSGPLNSITLTPKQLSDNREIVWSYSNAITAHLLATSSSGPPSSRNLQIVFASSLFGAYLACSYLDDARWVKNPISADPWFISLWELRQKFSPLMIDHAVVYSMPQLVSEGGQKDSEADDLNSYLGRAIGGGLYQMSSNVQADNERYTKILASHGIKVKLFGPVRQGTITIK
jgi:hypothetical protein